VQEIVERLTGRSYLSWSAISTFMKCPLKYRFHYIDQEPEEFISANLVFGSAIHSAIESFYSELLASNRRLSLDSMMTVYDDKLSNVELDQVEFGKGDDQTTLKDLARRMLERFLEHEISRPAGNILGIEESIQQSLLDDCPEFLAILDLIVETEDSITITDFKTARTRWSNQDILAASGQLILYHELARAMSDKPIRLQFAVMTKTKTPDITILEVIPTEETINRVRQIIHSVWRSIQTGNFYPIPSSMNCSTCGYRNRCSNWPGT
ncbi:MAG: PD-(D/E)XK nuclease family protein, partial [Planctomycetes bacterium]|nr:PD-(D/E)XK nuclease family protein [Planctomycetota bacterium]